MTGNREIVRDFPRTKAVIFSITAGFGIMGVNLSQPPLLAAFNSFNEYRGLSYSIGGDEGALTVPNYVKHYQPNLKGYSIDSHIALYCSGKEDEYVERKSD